MIFIHQAQKSIAKQGLLFLLSFLFNIFPLGPGLSLKSKPKIFMNKPMQTSITLGPSTPNSSPSPNSHLSLNHSSIRFFPLLATATATEELDMRGFSGGPRSWSKLPALRAMPPRRPTLSAVEHVQLQRPGDGAELAAAALAGARGASSSGWRRRRHSRERSSLSRWYAGWWCPKGR